MSRETTAMTERLLAYIREVGMREDEDLRKLREETASHPAARMQISPEQGQFMALLVELIGVKRAFEVGTFTGYSAMCVTKAMGRDGRLVALDVSEEYTSIAQEHWKAAGVHQQIELKIGPAAESLEAMVKEGEGGTFDFAFIDADKTGYMAYYEYALKLLRPGGLVAIDNVLWNGSVADPKNNDEDTVAIRKINAFIKTDNRVTMSLVPIGDGLTLARKR